MRFIHPCRGAAAVVALGLLSACATQAEPTTSSNPPPAATPDETCHAVEASEETLRVKNDLGTIEGTLLVPEGCGPLPVALIIAGSGPTDRDGNEPKMYRLLAQAL